MIRRGRRGIRRLPDGVGGGKERGVNVLTVLFYRIKNVVCPLLFWYFEKEEPDN